MNLIYQPYLIDYAENKGKRMEKLAFQYLITDLLQDNLHGPRKMREVTGLDMEEHLKSNFIPASFYVFIYNDSEIVMIDGEKFYDAVPMILCTSVGKKSIRGINFNYIPNNIRALFLDSIVDINPDFYNHDVFDKGLRVDEKLGKMLSNEDLFLFFLNAMKQKFKFDFCKCIRTYDREKIINPRMIEIDMWRYIPHLSFNDAIRGYNLAKIQANLAQNK